MSVESCKKRRNVSSRFKTSWLAILFKKVCKAVDYKSVIECRISVKIYFIGLKKTCLGVLERGERDKDNETGLKEGGGIAMSTTVLPLRDARSFALYTYLFFSFLRKRILFFLKQIFLAMEVQ